MKSEERSEADFDTASLPQAVVRPRNLFIAAAGRHYVIFNPDGVGFPLLVKKPVVKLLECLSGPQVFSLHRQMALAERIGCTLEECRRLLMFLLENHFLSDAASPESTDLSGTD